MLAVCLGSYYFMQGVWGVGERGKCGLVLLTTNGGSKTGAHTDGAGGSQHFRVAGLILIDALE